MQKTKDIPGRFGFLVSEASGHRSRESIVIAENQTLKAGAVLGQVTTGGQYVELNPAASDGSEAAAAILGEAVTTGAGETEARAVVIRDAEVNSAELIWPTGITAPQQTAAIGELNALGIVLR